jgi:hypothetical protein
VLALGCGDDSQSPAVDASPHADAPRIDGAIDAPAIDAPSVDGAIDAPAIDGPPPDAACVPSGAENCFNGIDDDCNGLTDCADPACNAIAECVPEPAGFALGVHVPMGTACPVGYATTGPLLTQGLSAGGPCTGCSCSGITVCGTTVHELSSGTCPGTDLATRIVFNTQCQSLSFTTTNVHVDAVQLQSTCSFSGTPIVPPISWATQTQFCQASRMGAGCPTGNVCVQKATSLQHCALQAGSVTCAGNYTPESGGTWYTSVNDSRTCGASCTCAHSGGDCGTSFVRGFTVGSVCSGGAIDLTSNADNCNLSAPLSSARVILQGDTPPTCTPNNVLSGTATPSGPQTLCCL